MQDEKFCLGDLLALELHNYVDACSEIVDRAQKELNIEKQLKKIEDTWAGLNLMFSPYQVGKHFIPIILPQRYYLVCESVVPLPLFPHLSSHLSCPTLVCLILISQTCQAFPDNSPRLLSRSVG